MENIGTGNILTIISFIIIALSNYYVLRNQVKTNKVESDKNNEILDLKIDKIKADIENTRDELKSEHRAFIALVENKLKHGQDQFDEIKEALKILPSLSAKFDAHLEYHKEKK